MTIEFIIYLGVAVLSISIPLFYWGIHRKKSKTAELTLKKAIESGRDEPVSLHPIIDPDTCIGSGACVKACPEKSILGLIDNRGALINPSSCIGHGMCEAACPVNAITLVFGSEKRGVDIPHLKGTFETNVRGIYIAGELGGMGLIRNAVTQGVQAAQYIASSLGENKRGDSTDLAIVGAGPAGIAAALQAKKAGLSYLLLDQESLGGTILSYPRKKLVMTAPMDFPGYGKVKLKEILKEELLEIFEDVLSKTDISCQGGGED